MARVIGKGHRAEALRLQGPALAVIETERRAGQLEMKRKTGEGFIAAGDFLTVRAGDGDGVVQEVLRHAAGNRPIGAPEADDEKHDHGEPDIAAAGRPRLVRSRLVLVGC